MCQTADCTDWAPDLRTVRTVPHRHAQRAHGHNTTKSHLTSESRSPAEHQRSRERARNACLACTHAAIQHTQRTKSFERICGALREVLESKSTSCLSVELSGERFVIPVQETRRHARFSQTGACAQRVRGGQPFSEKFQRAGIRIRL